MFWDGGDYAVAFLTFFGGVSFVVLAIGSAVRRIREVDRKRLPADPEKRAIAIAQERYARGELSREEYLELRGYLSLEETHSL